MGWSKLFPFFFHNIHFVRRAIPEWYAVMHIWIRMIPAKWGSKSMYASFSLTYLTAYYYWQQVVPCKSITGKFEHMMARIYWLLHCSNFQYSFSTIRSKNKRDIHATLMEDTLTQKDGEVSKHLPQISSTAGGYSRIDPVTMVMVTRVAVNFSPCQGINS